MDEGFFVWIDYQCLVGFVDVVVGCGEWQVDYEGYCFDGCGGDQEGMGDEQIVDYGVCGGCFDGVYWVVVGVFLYGICQCGYG